MNQNRPLPKLVGYYANWSVYDRDYFPWDIPTSNLTHLNYAFANIVDGVVCPGDAWADLEKPMILDGYPEYKGAYAVFNSPDGPIRRKNPNLKVLISIGGWSFSKDFSKIAQTSESRYIFINSAIKFMEENKFDGIDLDWEFPVEGGLDGNHHHPNDANHFVQLLKGLRIALNELSMNCNRKEPYLLTVATSGAAHSFQHLDLAGMASYLDWFNLMTYDFSGPWSHVCHHHASLFPDPENPEVPSAFDAVNGYVNRGVPSHQIVLGIPFYGRAFANVEEYSNNPPDLPPSSNVGFGRKFCGVPDPSSPEGICNYRDLRKDQLTKLYPSNPNAQWHRIWNDKTKTVHIWDPINRTFVGFEDNQSICWKAFYIKDQNLGGAMIWELYGDFEYELINALASEFLR